jgi:amino acid adenylation domain-containing protein
LFEQQVRMSPAAVALVDPGQGSLTYAGLNARANRLAWLLLASGVRRGDLVGLRARRSADCVTAMLGVLKAGAAYVPLEDGLPADRLRQMAAECEPRLIITIPPLEWDGPGPAVLSLAREAAGLTRQPDRNPGLTVSPEDLMYVPYTSGSSGQPKGTLVPHRSIPGFFAGTDYASWGPGHVSLLHSALSWDGHVLEIYPALLTGGRVVIAQDSADPAAVARTARAQGVTYLFLTTTVFNTIVDHDASLLAGVRDLLVGGEPASRDHVARAMTALPGTRIVNGYGPSECTAFSTVHVITEADLSRGRPGLPIGRAVGDRRVCLLGPGGQPVPDGTPGELCVSGPGVAHGYLRRPVLTAERFVPDPSGTEPGQRMYRTGDIACRGADGIIEYIGRMDTQLKIRGVRVEPGEIEAVLREHPQVKDAVVTAAPGTGADVRLLAYLVLTEATGVTAAGLRRHLRRSLPGAMIPAAFARVGQIPLTSNGKADRDSLHAMASEPLAEAAGDAPGTEPERRIAAVWQAVLGLDRIGLDDNFFDLGGHSLSGVRVLAALREAGFEIAATDLHRHQTVRALAGHVAEQDPSPASGGDSSCGAQDS